MIVVVESATEAFDGSWLLKLADHTGQMEGFITKSTGGGGGGGGRAGVLQRLEALQAKQQQQQPLSNSNNNSSSGSNIGGGGGNNLSRHSLHSSYSKTFSGIGDVVLEFPSVLIPGSVLVLEKVSLFIGKEKCTRYLNICFDHIVTVFSSQ